MAPKAEQTEIPGTEREVNQKLENVIRKIKSKTEEATLASNEKRKAQDEGREKLREENMSEYVSEKQGFVLRSNDREGVKLQHWSPPKPSKPEADA